MIVNTILDEVKSVLSKIDENQTIELASLIQKADRIFLLGAGRSSLNGKMFAMRLMQSGFHVYIVGETITPSIGEKDLLLIISGSGKTKTLQVIANKAKQTGAKIALLTANEDSALWRISDFTLSILASTKHKKTDGVQTIQPLGSQFDQSIHILLDALIVYLLRNSIIEKDNTLLAKRHANLE